jgi:hypothetical protein
VSCCILAPSETAFCNIDNIADPGSLHDLQLEHDLEQRLEQCQEQGANSSASSEDGSYQSEESLEDSSGHNPNVELPRSSGFVPQIEELKTALEFNTALQDASLDNGDLSRDALDRLHNPSTHVFEIDDPNELYSLKMFLATNNTSRQTYVDLRNHHNERYPGDPMLSYDQIKRKVTEWTSIEAIVHDMCHNSCITYTGPFSDHEQCPHCSEPRYDALRLENSNGKVKVASQQFYTLPLGPQLQALWRSPDRAS